MYDLDVKPKVDKIFKKLSKKNPKQLKIIAKKILEIRTYPLHKYKFLKKPLQKFNRTHIDDHFILMFHVNHKKKLITIYKYKHHDEAYK
ncbi:hypothetical protein HOK51_03300 [Candidatus Woesearchaeota archaeon]|jgi:mRNA-degrading endonuclease RelE of RelBE toxin-antitoxin system|nr:hypothetical protein [Candidatus Woesearchaeota archaeon]MBT6518846.1 hypothetical protein [Candidatus Woesearchaeota archaeon]MBT7367985.1 hypothetical protein [Candidatus Woesearchaeota archaeon]